jgi:hypothetical protein
MGGSVDHTRLAEHFAFWSSLSLAELCNVVRDHFHLPEFEYGSENETEWGLVLRDGLEYNISCPYEDGTLQEWDSSVPPDCNVGFTLSVSMHTAEPRDAKQSAAELVPRIGQVLADLFAQPVCHHRTWLGPGKNITRMRVFQPRPPLLKP